MKTPILVLSLLIFNNIILGNTDGYKKNDTNTNSPQSELDKDREGDLNNAGAKSLKESITFFQNNDELQVIFGYRLSWISICIYDENRNILYEDFIDTFKENSIQIDISYLEKGNYTIEFINLENHKLTGRFRL